MALTPTAATLVCPPLLLHKFRWFSLSLSLPSRSLFLYYLSLLQPAPLKSACLWPCTSKSCFCLPLQAAYICLLSVETKETDHKAYYGARSGIHGVCARECARDLETHTNPLPLSSSLTSCDASHMVSRQAAH